MKTLLLLLLFGMCAAGWFGAPFLEKLAKKDTASVPMQEPDSTQAAIAETNKQSYVLSNSNFIKPDPAPVQKNMPAVLAENSPARCMSVTEFEAQGKTDPKSYAQLVECDPRELGKEHSSVDKLMNFLAHLKYE